jgi:hypothetical protein
MKFQIFFKKAILQSEIFHFMSWRYLIQCSTLETRRSKNKTKVDSWKIINLFPSQWHHKYWDFQLHDTNCLRCDEARYTPRALDMNWNLRWYVHSFRHSAKFSWHGQGKILTNFMLVFLGYWRCSYAGLTKRATMSVLQTIPNSLCLVRPRTVVLAGKFLGSFATHDDPQNP